MTLFERLVQDERPAWDRYVDHEFVRRLGDGTLPAACYRRYLVQDWLFLGEFARTTALAAVKADTLEDVAASAATVTALIEIEMPLHVRTCAGWGIDEAALAATPPAVETLAYTGFVLARGQGGDVLDLLVALAPCVLGYGAIGRALAASASPDTPYRAWIDAYAGPDYAAVASAAERMLERAWLRRGGPARLADLRATFRTACRLEAAFWQMGLDGGGEFGGA